jgi:pilus assembly protein CpaF
MPADVTSAYERMKAKLKLRLLDLLDGMPHEQDTPARRKVLEEQLLQVVKGGLSQGTQVTPFTPDEQARLVAETVNELVGYDVLDQLIADPTISEIMVNGPNEIYIERDGRLERIPETFRDEQHLMSVIERMLGTVHLTVNEANPLCDASLPDGSRINVIIPPLVLNGPVVTIRRKLRDWTMPEYLKLGVLSEQAAAFLEDCIKAKVNIVISGGTSTGKTTLVSILTAYIPPEHRIITIENVSELELTGCRHWIRLVAKLPNVENKGEIPLRTLVKNALRMRPDRIILGEARGGEALDVVQAMHSGHDGFITVLHANSARAALERMETLMLMSGLDLPPSACRTQIASAVDLVIHVGRFVDGTRRVATISQVLGASPQEGFDMEDLFVFEAEGFTPEGQLKGICKYTGAKPKFLEKFHLNNVPVPAWLTT